MVKDSTAPIVGITFKEFPPQAQISESSFPVSCFVKLRYIPRSLLNQPDNTTESWNKQMSTGTVKWFNNEKGFGFITPNGGGEDLFVHHTEIQGTGFRSLADGEQVEFTTAPGRKGMQAVGVHKV